MGGLCIMTESAAYTGQAYDRPLPGSANYTTPVPVACRACGSPILYPRPCPKCGATSTWVSIETVVQPPLGVACWHVREGDPYGVERWWDGHQWTTQIVGGEKMRWLEDLKSLPEQFRTPYTADQIELLTKEIERIAWAIDPMGPPSTRKRDAGAPQPPHRSWASRLFGRS